MPSEFVLHQNFPNPFNPATTIHYRLPEQTDVVLKVYTMVGHHARTLVRQIQTAGFKSVSRHGSDDLGAPMSSGVYMLWLKAGDRVQSRSMILLR
jgi:hypothetical protein